MQFKQLHITTLSTMVVHVDAVLYCTVESYRLSDPSPVVTKKWRTGKESGDLDDCALLMTHTVLVVVRMAPKIHTKNVLAKIK